MKFGLPERPSKGLDLLKALDEGGRIAGPYRLDAVRTHLLDMVGDHDGAITHYRDAAARTTSSPERNHLMTQAARLRDSSTSSDRSIPSTEQ